MVRLPSSLPSMLRVVRFLKMTETRVQRRPQVGLAHAHEGLDCGVDHGMISTEVNGQFSVLAWGDIGKCNYIWFLYM